MTANEVIPIKPMKLRNQKMHSDGKLRLELYDLYFKYVGDFFAKEPKDREDHNLGWEDVDNRFEIIVDKKAVAGIDKSWVSACEHWAVYIFVTGMSDDIKIFFETQHDADFLVNKLINYLYGDHC